MLKYKLNVFFILFAFTCQAQAPFVGGVGSGSTFVQMNAHELNGTPANSSLFLGNNQDGYDMAEASCRKFSNVLDDFSSFYKGGVSGGYFRGIMACRVSPLPIVLLSFSFTCNEENKTVLEWTTASEKNNDFFYIERSADGITFEEIGKEKGAGNSNQQLSYSWVDEYPSRFNKYYRLKQVDYDGSFSYSPTIATLCYGENFSFRVWPNPTNGILTVLFQGNTQDASIIRIVDGYGKLVIEKPVTEDQSTELIIDLKNEAPGTYFIYLTSKSSVKVEKIILQR
ncbi:MAG: T9SS type A sorting domain-containing protein [Bacteroidia bacterium]